MSDITRGEIVRVGVDLAKRVIQVHAVDATGRVVGDVPAVVATGDGAGHVTRPSLARQRELARYLDPVQL